MSGGRIVAVGSDDEVRALAGPTTEVVDIGGGLLTPGFQDAHVHPVYGGTQMSSATCTTRDARRVRRGGRGVRSGASGAAVDPRWRLVDGGVPRRTPTRQLLDAVVPDRPVFLPNRDGHSGWVNSEALRRPASPATRRPVDGRIEHDADGEPTGACKKARWPW